MAPSRARVLVLCACIGLNSLAAGSIFCFPLVGPPLQRRLGLSMSKTNAIALGAILGQYLSAPLFGFVADRSARASSFCGCVFHALGYSLMAFSLASHKPPTFAFFIAYYGLVGAGTVSGYLAAITSSARSFPHHSGLAIGVPSAIFSISPLVLSELAGWLFVQHEGAGSGDIDAVRLFAFFAVFGGIINLTSAILLKPLDESETGRAVKSPASLTPTSASSLAGNSTPSQPDETSPLLPTASLSHVHIGLRKFLMQPSVWIFLAIIVLVNGPTEVISQNLGSMSEALLPPSGSDSQWPDSHILAARSRQIQIFSAVNTASRLLFGFVADWTSPLTHDASGNKSEKFQTPRLTYLQLAATLLFAASLYAITLLQNVNGLWVVTILCALSYGVLNVIGPSLVAKVWGEQDFGRNFGVLWSIAAVGPVFYGLLYGGVSDHFSHDQLVPSDIEASMTGCRGRICFQWTFAVIAVSAVIAVGLVAWLKRKRAWKRV